MSDRRRKASIALGIFVIALIFILETVVAHHARPHPLSPLVWAVLGVVAAVSLGVFLLLRADPPKG